MASGQSPGIQKITVTDHSELKPSKHKGFEFRWKKSIVDYQLVTKYSELKPPQVQGFEFGYAKREG